MSAAGSRARVETEQGPRRRMRKGTKSCLPCRSRKVRCNYPPNSRVCTACLAQGRNCVEQTYQDVKNGDLDRRVGLKQRVRELENLVQRLVEKGSFDAQDVEGGLRTGNVGLMSPPDSTTSRSQTNESVSNDQAAERFDEQDSSDSYDSLDDVDLADHGSYQKAPLMALFDNNLLLRDDSQEEVDLASRARQDAFGVRRHGTPTKARETKLVEELRALFPPWEAINAILEHGSKSIAMWQDVILENSFFGMSSVDEGIRKMSQSDQPVELCKGLTFLALVMQQTPETETWRNRSLARGESQTRLTQKYLETVEAHLCAGHNLIATLDGLECAVLLCRILFNEGRPRKAWLLYQRALSYARLLGFHRSASWKTTDPSIGVRRQQTWWLLFVGDRALSLLLGLPYSVMDSHMSIDPNGFKDPLQPSRRLNFFNLRLALITGRIIDRNQSSNNSLSSTYTETMKIDGELRAFEADMPEAWLALGSKSGDASEFVNMGPRDILQALTTLAWHNECKIAAHMPYLMRHTHDGEDDLHDYSRKIAIDTARSVIRTQLRVRSFPDLSNVICQVFDFQVFMSTVLLILDLLSSTKDTGMPRILKGDAETREDEELIKQVFGMLRRLAELNTTKMNIPAQAMKVLETLGRLIKDQNTPGATRSNQRIVIPYFGSITIKATGDLLEHRKAVQEHIGNPNCSPSCDIPSAYAGEATSGGTDASATMPLPSHEQIDSTLFDLQANDLTFNSFLVPQFSFESMPLAQSNGIESLGSMQPEPSSSTWPNIGTGDPCHVMETAPPAWDETVWQNILTQDPTADLDMDWERLLGNL